MVEIVYVLCALTSLLEGISPGEIGQPFEVLEEAVRAEAAGVHDALGDSLVVEVEHLLAHHEVVHERWPAFADLQRVLIVGDRNALRSRQLGLAGATSLVRLASRTDFVRRWIFRGLGSPRGFAGGAAFGS